MGCHLCPSALVAVPFYSDDSTITSTNSTGVWCTACIMTCDFKVSEGDKYPVTDCSLSYYFSEIEKFQGSEGKKEDEEKKYLDVISNKNIKLSERVLIPVKQYPKVL